MGIGPKVLVQIDPAAHGHPALAAAPSGGAEAGIEQETRHGHGQ